MVTLAQVRAAQPEWFSRKNRRFFGDVSYKILHGKVTHKPYLVRATNAWTDMFGQPKRLHYRLNRLKDDLTIGTMLDQSFPSIEAVKYWLEFRETEAVQS